MLLFLPLLAPAVDLRFHGLPQEGAVLSGAPPDGNFAPRALTCKSNDIPPRLDYLHLLSPAQVPLRLQSTVPPPASGPPPAALNIQGCPVPLPLEGTGINVSIFPLAAVDALNAPRRPRPPEMLLPPQEVKNHGRRPPHAEPPENGLNFRCRFGTLHQEHPGPKELNLRPVGAGDQPPTEEPLNDPRGSVPDTQLPLHSPGFTLGLLCQPALPPPEMGLDYNRRHAPALADHRPLGHHLGLCPPARLDHLSVSALNGDCTALLPLYLSLRKLRSNSHSQIVLASLLP
mmetsp:Transcript_93245/g.213132  ORF Transcript_93245/g.213132 Transcript_93245/m.213132 type:complete len:287 (-) Transcript_93245:783-1643(-)